MPTTLSLDDDVARRLTKEMRGSGAPSRQLSTISSVLDCRPLIGLPASRFVVTPRKRGLPPVLSYDNVEQFLEAVEGGAHP